MSSMYPSFGGAAVRPCMRCGGPLAPNESQCSRCGTINPLPQGQPFGMSQQGQQPGPSGSGWSGQVPQPPQFPQNGNGAWPNPAGSSAGWGSTGQAGGWPQNTLFPSQNHSPSQPLQPGPFSNNGNAGPFANTGNGFSNPNQSAMNNAFANFQQNPNQANNFFAASQQKGYGASPQSVLNNPNRRGYKPNDDDDDHSKRPGGAVIAVIVILLVALVGGGIFVVPKMLNHNNNTANGTATPATITTPTGQPLFSDFFKDNSTNWNLNAPTGQKCSIAGGKLMLETDNHALFPLILPGKAFADFRLDVDAGLTGGDAGNGYGVYIRAASTPNNPLGLYYRFEVYGDGSFLVYKGLGDGKDPANISDAKKSTNSAVFALAQGKLNHLTIIAKGPKLDFIINGVNVVSITDVAPVYTSGSVALFASEVKAAQSGAQATFQNLAMFPAQ